MSCRNSTARALTTVWLLLATCLQCRAWDRTEALDRAKDLCRLYMDGFWHSNTGLVYGQRLNTERGLAVFTSPEEIAKEQVRGKYMPYGYGSGIQDPGLLNGMLLFALCDAYEATEDDLFADHARRIFGGLKSIATVSPVPGFVPRGPHPDGKSYYRDSSLDQHSLFVCGLWRYFRSPLATADDKSFIRNELHEFAERMERNKWTLLVEDDSRVAHVGWCWLPMTPLNAEIMLSMLGAVKDVTEDAHWVAEYERISSEQDGKRWRLLAGELNRLPRFTMYSDQNDFRLITLARLETDSGKKAIASGRVHRRARDMLTGSVFVLWRKLDWIGSRPDDVVNEFLGHLGLSLESTLTVDQLWDRFEPSWRSPKLSDGTRPWGQPIGIRIPLLAWHVALLSGDPGAVSHGHQRVPGIYSKLDFAKEHSGWTVNYAVLAVLLDLATWPTAASTQESR